MNSLIYVSSYSTSMPSAAKNSCSSWCFTVKVKWAHLFCDEYMYPRNYLPKYSSVLSALWMSLCRANRMNRALRTDEIDCSLCWLFIMSRSLWKNPIIIYSYSLFTIKTSSWGNGKFVCLLTCDSEEGSGSSWLFFFLPAADFLFEMTTIELSHSTGLSMFLFSFELTTYGA